MQITGMQKIGLMVEAEEAWRIAVALDPNLVPALTSLGNLEGARGNIERVRFKGKPTLLLSVCKEMLVAVQNSPVMLSSTGRLLASFYIRRSTSAMCPCKCSCRANPAGG